MNPRMNSGRGFQVPPEKDAQIRGPWVPLTPGRPILQRSNGIPVERHENQLGRTNWHEVLELPGQNLQQTTNNRGVGHDFNGIGLMGQNGSSYNLSVPLAEKGSFNQNVGSHAQSFHNDSAAWNNNPLAGLLAAKNVTSVASANGTWNTTMEEANAPTILNLYSQVDSSWTEGNFTSLLLGSKNPNLGSNHWINADSTLQMPRDGFPVPDPFYYNLNSPPRSEADATSSTTNSFPLAPDHATQFENFCHSEMLNFSVDESSSQEKDKLKNLLASIGSEAIENHCNELQNIVDSSSAAVSTVLMENNNSEGGNQCIDLNKTPQQKPPKRRKHRPKVIMEGKPKRTPKPKTPKNTNSMENPSGKRKYVRKKSLEATASQQTENPSGKRKYVRKKSLEATASQQTDAANEVPVPSFESKAKSCRKKLNFDLENNEKGESQGKAAFKLNLDSQATELCTGIKSIGRSESAEIRVQNGYTAGNQQAGSTCNLTHSRNQMPAESIQFPERCVPAAPPAAIKYNTLNSIASLSMRNASLYQNSDKNGYSQEHQHLQGELNRNMFQSNNTLINLEETRQVTWQSIRQMVERNMTNSNAKRGLKREYRHTYEQAGPSAENQKCSPFVCQEISQVDDHNSNSCNFGTRCSETHKKMRTENGFHTTVCSIPWASAFRGGSRQVATEGRNSAYANSYASQTNSRILNSYFGGEKTSKNLNYGINSTCGDGCFAFMTTEHNTQMQLTASELHSNTVRMAEKRHSRSTQVYDITSLAVMANSNLLPSTPHTKNPTSNYEQGLETCHANMSVKKHNMAPTSSRLVLSCRNAVLLQEHQDASHDYRQSFMKARGQPKKQQYTDAVDEITCRLQGLNITSGSKKIDGQEKNALVPYKGDGTMVPYKRFEPIKKRKPRPKVDLDPESNRIWKLLMGIDGSEDAELENKDKEKWWEEERKVFRGRADSFIARMHLVQGDRRFSQWKGSVVDSVIGVFLTQNVSDHLSSSAFMSLAARFPLQSNTTIQTRYQSGTSTAPEIQTLDPYGTIKCYEKIVRQPVYNQASVTYQESSENRAEYPTSGTGRTSLATEHNGTAEEIASSSQNSSDSFVLQVNGEIQSCSGSNSEAEDSTRGGKSNSIQSPPTLLHMRRTASFQVLDNPVTGSLCFEDRSTHWHKHSEDIDYNMQIPRLDKFNNLKNSSTLTQPINSKISYMQGPIVSPSHSQLYMTPDMAAREADCFGMLREESSSSLPSTASGITKGKGIDYLSRRFGHPAERIRKNIVRQDGVPMIQAPTIGPCAFPTKNPTHQESSLQSVPHTGKDQLSLSTHQQERSRTFQLESRPVKEPIRPSEVPTRKSVTRHQVPHHPKYTGQTFGVEESAVVNKQKFLDTKAVVANAKEKVYFSGETTTGMSTNMPNARKGKTDAEKRKSFDWDSLRKLVQPNGRRKERSKGTMDSLDYEAVRCADVNEISNAIRERGMNNMLAERMKDFLNRLVREHGSTDLEWLRDVPPDKAKDYLLSIRGLGLKSVECVRLLTLHHLAFPVDTNVGRIAVRLGWVPLQPLPESLQLHLLELYPMLESIQKYLWPRLCKLDQRTLYELHYQMITFGKVFCTKSKPNCNACPMRGECRHFASAYASARLSLPGPEEKSIVSSTIPLATDKSPAVVIKPMPLPPVGSSELKDTLSIVGNCVPIVEEPTTPEPETAEVSLSDIENAFYEDPDEIPTIKLNIEKFALNLHQYMQENMELQESDMSKALVALNPEAASIPTPKLKNVSRLRTEHQVYELPDSHPVLEGMDKREPDDPSPYLLAIWTPGETANSVQPPERSCVSQELGKLCNEKTCSSCNAVREANSQTVRGTVLIPCRTAMRGSFPLNGTYFQVNEMFADHESSLNPIDVPRAWLWNLPRRTVFFGTSVSTIFKGQPTEEIQYCFWRGFVCVRGFDQKTRAPRPLMARLHFPASKLAKTKNE